MNAHPSDFTFLSRTQTTRFGLVWITKTDDLLSRGEFAVKGGCVIGTIVIRDTTDDANVRWLVHVRPGYVHEEIIEGVFPARKRAKTSTSL